MRTYLHFTGRKGIPSSVWIGLGCNITFLSRSPAFDGGSTLAQTPLFWKWSSKDREQPHQIQLLSEGHSCRDVVFTPNSPSLPSCPSFLLFLLHISFNIYFMHQKWVPVIEAVPSFSWSHSSYLVLSIRFFLSQEKIHLGTEEILKTEKPYF